MKFKWLWFDIDNTLLDFEGASKLAFWQVFDDFGLECSQNYYNVYHEINSGIWSDFEQGKISAERLRIKRFEDLLNALEIGGIDAADFSRRYLEDLVVKSETYHNVHELIEELSREYLLSIVTNGLKEVQRPRLHKLKLAHHFQSIVVSDEIGLAKPHIDYFQRVYESIEHNINKEEILIIGDNLKSDIIGGLNFGIETCWLSHDKVNTSEITPHYTINSIHDFRKLLTEINN